MGSGGFKDLQPILDEFLFSQCSEPPSAPSRECPQFLLLGISLVFGRTGNPGVKIWQQFWREAEIPKTLCRRPRSSILQQKEHIRQKTNLTNQAPFKNWLLSIALCFSVAYLERTSNYILFCIFLYELCQMRSQGNNEWVIGWGGGRRMKPKAMSIFRLLFWCWNSFLY